MLLGRLTYGLLVVAVLSGLALAPFWSAARPLESLAEDPRERLRIVQILESARWNRGRAAEALGMSRSTLWRRMKELGIE